MSDALDARQAAYDQWSAAQGGRSMPTKRVDTFTAGFKAGRDYQRQQAGAAVNDELVAAPDYKALYFELAHQIGTVQRIKAAAFDGQADGKQFWEAQGRLDDLVGAALSWESDPDLYAQLLARARGER